MPVEREQESAGNRPPDDARPNRLDDRLPAAPGGGVAAAGEAPRPTEIGGPKGPEPTRYGDWERAGRCVDF
jgi:hypothetical protein